VGMRSNANGSLAPRKVDELTSKMNILRRFVDKVPAEAEGDAKDAGEKDAAETGEGKQQALRDEL